MSHAVGIRPHRLIGDLTRKIREIGLRAVDTVERPRLPGIDFVPKLFYARVGEKPRKVDDPAVFQLLAKKKPITNVFATTVTFWICRLVLN